MNSHESVSTVSDADGSGSRNRSASRRRRRRGRKQRQYHGKSGGETGGINGNSRAMTIVDEEELSSHQQEESTPDGDGQNWLQNHTTQDIDEPRAFDHIKPASQSMNGPVTYARMLRGEIPWRGSRPRQLHHDTQDMDSKDSTSDPMKQDGLKLRLELNLDIEIELKAHIHGDITLSLL